ncbi:MAG: hypothetical protein IMW89_13095 [Ktedonobacteraceae bacterium]|nr:hypothetical protein [Ktedonobacteraceae bacterium]
MNFGSLISGLLKGKFLIVALVSVAVAGGAAAAASATPPGQQVIQTIVGHATPTSVQDQSGNAAGKGKTATPDAGQNKQAKDCPGLPDAQRLAGKFTLSTADDSNSIKTLCALHKGNFHGTTSSGASVTTSHVYGYGEVDLLLTYARYLATHNGGKLSDANVQTYVADALKSCGTTPLMRCLTTNIPNYQPGHENNADATPQSNSGNGSNNGDNGGSSGGNGQQGGNDHGKGKPTVTPPTPTPPAVPTVQK